MRALRIGLSPRGFAVAALGLAAAFLVLHVLGFREETRFLSGTPANVTQGMLYAVFYFLFVLVVPILVIAAGLGALLDLAARRTAGPGAKEGA